MLSQGESKMFTVFNISLVFNFLRRGKAKRKGGAKLLKTETFYKVLKIMFGITLSNFFFF